MSLHGDALTTLSAWTPPSATQEALRDRFVAHLRSHPDGLDRACRPDHLTASTVVLDHDGSHVLLTLHAKARRWFQLGGHCEPDDVTLAGAAGREATEESGIDALLVSRTPVHLSEHEVPFCGGPLAHGRPVHHLDVRYAAVAPADAELLVGEESLDLRWWPVEALPDADPEPELVELVGLGRRWLASQEDRPDGGSVNSSGGVMLAASDQPSR